MNNIKKTGLGIATAAAATVLVAGFASPAMASTTHGDASSNSSNTNKTEASSVTQLTQSEYNALRNVSGSYTGGSASNKSPIYFAPSVNEGDLASGNAIGSGNDSAPLSGNTYSVPVVSGNDSALFNNDGNNNGDANKLGSGDSAGNGNSAGNGDSSAITGNGITGNTVTNSAQKIVKSVTSDSGNSTSSNSVTSSKSNSTSTGSTSTDASTLVNNIDKGLGMSHK